MEKMRWGILNFLNTLGENISLNLLLGRIQAQHIFFRFIGKICNGSWRFDAELKILCPLVLHKKILYLYCIQLHLLSLWKAILCCTILLHFFKMCVLVLKVCIKKSTKNNFGQSLYGHFLTMCKIFQQYCRAKKFNCFYLLIIQ